MSFLFDVYEVREIQSQFTDQVTFIFQSVGNRILYKVVSFDHVYDDKEISIYNFGFGDFVGGEDFILDNVESANGDTYKVFRTVLSVIPRFFEIRQGARVVVKGSDSSPEFEIECRKNCHRNCDLCRKQHRRIRVYRRFVNSHFEELNQSFRFWGSRSITEGNQWLYSPYKVGEPYLAIFVDSRK